MSTYGIYSYRFCMVQCIVHCVSRFLEVSRTRGKVWHSWLQWRKWPKGYFSKYVVVRMDRESRMRNDMLPCWRYSRCGHMAV